jgi:hypothetical protein
LIRSRRVFRAGVAALAAASGLALALAASGARVRPEAKLGLWAMQEPEIVYVPQREAQQLLAQQQALNVIYSPEGQTDMWIRIAEAIDKDAVNDPALPPVPDAIKDEAGRAQQEQDLEREVQKNYNHGQEPGPFGFASGVQTLSMGGQEFALVPLAEQ